MSTDLRTGANALSWTLYFCPSLSQHPSHGLTAAFPLVYKGGQEMPGRPESMPGLPLSLVNPGN